jgi:5-methylcytosine-specific restriction protein A
MSIEADSLAGIPLAWTTDHAWLGTTTVDVFLCDCVIHRVLRAGSAVLDYGRATHTVPRDLFRAVAARDGGCRHPGCDRKVSWCDAHHIWWWRHQGPTELSNLVLLCSRHHHHVHRYKLQLKLLPDGDLEITYPDGTIRTSQPRGRPAQHGP